MKNIVVIGGGTGLSALLKGLKEIDDINLSAIVTVADDGGSTGVLRKEFNMPAVGDLRKVILALSANETLLDKIMNYRFETKNTFLDNHSLGNIILTALIEIENNFYKGIEKTKDLFQLQGEVIPVSNDHSITLKANYTDKTYAVGESSIPNFEKKIDYIEYVDDCFATNPLAIKKIEEADFIIFSMGSLYTSLIANLIIPDLKKAILNSKAKVIYLANVMTQNGETHDMSVCDHINAIEKHLDNQKIIDSVIISNDKIDDVILVKYANQHAYPVKKDDDLTKHHFQVVFANLLDEKSIYVRHDKDKLKLIFSNIINN